MANIKNEDFQKARRISKAIQEYLEYTGNEGARSTDVYDFLTNKGLIEVDRYQGNHFRRFLRKLKDNDLLKLIPQCSYSYSTNGKYEWYFHKSKQEITNLKSQLGSEGNRREHFPHISEDAIDLLIEKAKPHVHRLPKRDDLFTAQELQTRGSYYRAYEYWTEREEEILLRAYKKFMRIDKVAELLERQPSVVEKKLNDLNNNKTK